MMLVSVTSFRWHGFEFFATSRVQSVLERMKNFFRFTLASTLAISISGAEQAAKPGTDAPPPVDTVKFSGLEPEQAAAAVSVPEGFSMKMFAAEPHVQQPIAF